MKRFRFFNVIFLGVGMAVYFTVFSIAATLEFKTLTPQKWSLLPKQNNTHQVNDLIVDGGEVTVEGGEYGTILVFNDGKLTINGDTWAEDVVLRWGEIVINGNLNVTDTITIEENAIENNIMTVYGNNNSARQIDILGGIFYLLGTWSVDTMWINDGAKAAMIYTDWPDSGQLVLYCNQLTVAESGLIDGNSVGNDPRGRGCGYGCSGGGGYGGRGGRGYWDASYPGETYGDDYSLVIDQGAPAKLLGGGMLTVISSNNISIYGDIYANGGGGWEGGGSGGGILMISPQYDVRGRMIADGGNGDGNGGGGGGGRIKIFYNRSITTDDIIDNVSVKEGKKGGARNTADGEPGTIWIDAIPEEPVLISPADQIILSDNRPTFRFKVMDYSDIKDHRVENLTCIIELSTDNFRTVGKVFDQNISVEGWSDYTYKTGDVAEFTPPDPLVSGVRLYWRAYARDKSIKSDSSEIRTFLIKLTPIKIPRAEL